MTQGRHDMVGLRFGAELRRDVQRYLERVTRSARPLQAADLDRLPDPVRRYVRLSGAIGRPRIGHIRAAWRGRIRATPADPWMPFTAEQHNFPAEPARFFRMKARRNGLPVDVYHTFRGEAATMRVRLLGLIPLVDAHGPEMSRAETVTLLNDMCVLAPGTLVDPAIQWEPVDRHSAIVRYEVGSNTIAATLRFDEAGDLADFVSDDRLVASRGGAELTPCRWSTPLADYLNFGPHRAASRGEGCWHPPEGTFAYIQLELLDLELGPGPSPGSDLEPPSCPDGDPPPTPRGGSRADGLATGDRA